MALGRPPLSNVRVLRCERLEDRLLLSAASLDVALIDSNVAQSAEIQRAVAPGVIAVVFDASDNSVSRLANLVDSISAAHDGALIAHLGLVAHGGPGRIVLGTDNVLDLAALSAETEAISRLRHVLTPGAQIDLFSCSVAADASGCRFVDAIAADTGATVFASDHRFGTVPEANLRLKYCAGPAVERDRLFSEARILAIPGLCLGDSDSLVSQTVLANTQESPGAMFTQIWTMKNTGTTTWSPGASGYTLNLVGADCLGAVATTANTITNYYHPLTPINGGNSVAPGATATFTMTFVAPLTVGTYTDTFQMNNAVGNFFGPQITTQIVVAQAGGSGQYDRARAVSYANNYAGYYASDGYFWNSSSTYLSGTPGTTPVPSGTIGDDCAHFVSSCIGSQSSVAGGGLNIPSRVTPTYGEPGAGALINTVLLGKGYAAKVSSISGLSPGDVIGWDWTDDGVIDHDTLYLGNNLLAAHSTSYLAVPYNYYNSSYPNLQMYLIHINGTAAPPATPTGLAASSVGSQSVSLNWSAVSGATSYVVNRSTSSNGPWTQVYSGSLVQDTDNGLQSATPYYYQVYANSSAGKSGVSPWISATTLPGAPTGLCALSTAPRAALLSWNAVSGAIGYTLNRGTSSTGPWTQIYSGPAAQYQDAGLQPNSTYYYEVQSTAAAGSSAFSAPISLTTPAAATWCGAGHNTNWSTAANWGGVVASPNDDLTFSGLSGLSNRNDLTVDTQFGSITFDTGAGAFTLGGNSVSLAGNINNNSTNTQVVNLPLALVGSSHSLSALGGDLTLTGNISDRAGRCGIVVTGPRTVTLSGRNTYAGGTTVASGTLVIGSSVALPGGASLTIGPTIGNNPSVVLPTPMTNAVFQRRPVPATCWRVASSGRSR